MSDPTPTSDLDDQMREAIRRQREHGERAAWVDRRGWTTEQWCDDAERLMHDIDGAITSLVNGHVNALIRERRRLAAALRAAEAENADCGIQLALANEAIAAARVATLRLIGLCDRYQLDDQVPNWPESQRKWMAFAEPLDTEAAVSSPSEATGE